MKTIWMVYPYGPISGEAFRDSRYTLFGNELARHGYSVIWWTANFSHVEKTYRTSGWKDIKVQERFITRLVPTSSYTKNISIKRLIFESVFASNLKKRFNKLTAPDLIITAGTGMLNAFRPCWPYAKRHHIPVIYDIMDISLVDTYMSRNHKILAPFVKLVISVERKREKEFFDSVNGISALGTNQLQYALKRAGNREINKCLVYNGINVSEFRDAMKRDKLSDKVSTKESGWIWCIFTGSLGPSYDITTIIDCAKKCETNRDKVLFLIAGNGPQREAVEQAEQKCRNLKYLGFMALSDLAPFYSHCDIGLCAYAAYSTVDMPDKFYDYCAAGLAVINSLNGEVSEYIIQNNLGAQYQAGNVDSLYEEIMKLSNQGIIGTYQYNAYQIGDKFDINSQVKHLSEMVSSIFADSVHS